VRIAWFNVTTFCRRNTSSRLHSRVTLRDVFSLKNLHSRKWTYEAMKVFASPKTKLILVLLSFATIVLGFACVKRQHETNLSNQSTTRTGPQSQTSTQDAAAARININMASAQELEKLPGIGRGFAGRIVEHREKWGAFRRPEHLLMVRGLSDKRFRSLRDLITVE